MPDQLLRPDSLVLYRSQPARVRHVAKTLEIELSDGERLNVRTKDVVVLHPGPLRALSELKPRVGDVETAWQLLSGGATDLAELAELVYGDYSPAAAWAAWQLVADGLYFHGTPAAVMARTHEEVDRQLAARKSHAAEAQAWSAFLERARAGQLVSSDDRYLGEVEDLALGRRSRSRVLRELRRPETPESAHALLLELARWDWFVNPYPKRLGLDTGAASHDVPPLPSEPRTDLTHLPAFAVDDEDNFEPDDAVSLDGQRLWVHVADAAALVPPGSAIDQDALGRGATLYLPEGTVPMLPPPAIASLGLGLADISPALSIGLDLDGEGRVKGVEVVPSLVRVSRVTYADAEAHLGEEPFRSLRALTGAHREHRRLQGAVLIELPEMRLRVEGEHVSIRPLPPLQSRQLVAEAMLMAGAALARFLHDHSIPVPFTVQEPPASEARPQDLAGMFALRQTLRPSQYSALAGTHAGTGLNAYVQAASPLRRYLDLVVHQQLRAFLRGHVTMGTQEIVGRIGAAIAAMSRVRETERVSRQHWTLVYLLQHPGWEGEGVVVERYDRRAAVLIPELDLVTRVHLRHDLPLNSTVRLGRADVRLAELAVHFQVL